MCHPDTEESGDTKIEDILFGLGRTNWDNLRGHSSEIGQLWDSLRGHDRETRWL